MTALDVLENLYNTNLVNNNLKYCLVDKNKLPHTLNGNMASPNKKEDFVSLEEIVDAKDIENYMSLGISIQASDITAIDVDDCFDKPFDFESIDKRGKEIFNIFKDLAYIEFSFSGCGMRILFKQDEIEDYSTKYYIKNSKKQIEFYQPSLPPRYVTITSKSIADNPICSDKKFNDIIIKFLDTYMIRPSIPKIEIKSSCESEDLEILMKKVKGCYLKDISFQDKWFKKAPGFGHDESETDYAILCYLYTNVTQNPISLKLLFEQSPFFKSKDRDHIYKWNNNNFRYFYYLYGRITGNK